MESGVWHYLPDEIVLNIIARLLPRRNLYRLRSVWKAWNEMLSTYTAMRRMHPNIHLSNTCAFLFQFGNQYGYLTESVKTWVLEGSGDFYKVGQHSYIIELASNTMFILNHGNRFYICDETYLECIPHIQDASEGKLRVYDLSADKFIMLASDRLLFIDVYDSSTEMNGHTFALPLEGIPRSGYACDYMVSRWGVYHRGRFHWLNQTSCNGVVLELNFSDRCWTIIPRPHDAIYRDPVGRNIDASVYWCLSGSDYGQLILADRDYGIMWRLENGDDNINSKRWSRVDIFLPREILLVSVNNSGWTVVVGREGINVHDGSRRLVRKFAMNEIDPQLGMQIMKLKDRKSRNISLFPPLLPFECTYIWWPGNVTDWL